MYLKYVITAPGAAKKDYNKRDYKQHYLMLMRNLKQKHNDSLVRTNMHTFTFLQYYSFTFNLPFFLSFYISFFPTFFILSPLSTSSCCFLLHSLSPSLHLFSHLCMYLSIYLSIYPSINLSIYLSIYLYIYLSIYLYSSIHLPISLFSLFRPIKILKLALYELSTEQLLVMSASELADSNTQLLRAQQRSSAALSSQVYYLTYIAVELSSF